jgi:hypothetical protein
MSRRYQRREFLVDASFMLMSSVLLKVFAVPKAQEIAPVASTPAVTGEPLKGDG